MELRTPSYFALAALIDGPLHGYGIVRRAGELSGGTVRLSTGTVYALLERAIKDGLVVAGERSLSSRLRHLVVEFSERSPLLAC